MSLPTVIPVLVPVEVSSKVLTPELDWTVKAPAEVIVPLLVVDMLPDVVIASPLAAGCSVVPALDQ